MPSHFDLIITADYRNRTAELRLHDAHGSQLAFQQTDFKTIAVSRQQGLFDLRNYLRRYVDRGGETASVAEIGVCIAEHVLGKDIFRKLWESEAQRTLHIQLPGATEAENHLAAALARVPWEIARPAADRPTLGERNLLVRIVHDMAAPATQPLDLAQDECLRVLFVFAEGKAPGPKHAPPSEAKGIPLDEQPGYTGTAHALLQGGVSSVVAMRYAVGDDYARDLGVEFYRALLGHKQPKSAAAALTLAWQTISKTQKQDRACYDVCAHVTPASFGAGQCGVV